MIVETIRLDAQAREQLIRLKRYTGIEHWNVICRWALCLSLAEPSTPPNREFKGETGVEIPWRIFAGPYDHIFEGLIRQRCDEDGLQLEGNVLATQLHLHLHRGLGYLATRGRIQSIEDFISLLPLQDETKAA